MVVVDRFLNATDAETARALLEMEGIESALIDAEIEHIIGTAPGGIGLMVAEEDAECLPRRPVSELGDLHAVASLRLDLGG